MKTVLLQSLLPQKKAVKSILVAEYAVLLWAFSSQRVKINPPHPHSTQL